MANSSKENHLHVKAVPMCVITTGKEAGRKFHAAPSETRFQASISPGDRQAPRSTAREGAQDPRPGRRGFGRADCQHGVPEEAGPGGQDFIPKVEDVYEVADFRGSGAKFQEGPDFSRAGEQEIPAVGTSNRCSCRNSSLGCPASEAGDAPTRTPYVSPEASPAWMRYRSFLFVLS